MKKNNFSLDFKVGEVIEGFKIEAIELLDEYQAVGVSALHLKSGLQLFHFVNEDPENFFAFSFRTLPSDNTGVAHIIEHSILSGSKKYPLKDPFQAFLKGSVHTFMNAMTYPDKTVYPAASVLEKDYFNLMGLYGDAVFHPLLTREIFEQEAYRIEKDKEGSFVPKGIVFNEMQGSYGDKERVMYELAYETILPDTPYRYDSGGVPSSILDLDYASFLQFYEENYLPDRCKLFLYGNIATRKQLALLDQEILAGFICEEATNQTLKAPLQSPWEHPKSFEFFAPADENDDGLSMALVNWMIGEVSTPREALSFELLSAVLLSHEGSPLYRELIDSGLGEDLSPLSGMDTDIRQGIFSCGLRGMKKSACKKLGSAIFAILKKIVKEGISKENIEGTLRQFEFRFREIRGGIPNGLRMLDRSLNGWLNGESPTLFLKIDEVLKELRSEIESNVHFFEDLIQKLLIDNPHWTLLVVSPSEKESKRLSVELDRAVLDCIQRERILDPNFPDSRVDSFYEYQNRPDTEEALASIPLLSRDEVCVDVESLPLTVKENLYFYECYTNQISYFSVIADVLDFSDEEIFLLPVLMRMMVSSSIPDFSVEEVANELSLLTGGLFSSAEMGSRVDGECGAGQVAKILFRVKALNERFDEGVSFVFRLLKESRMDDLKKLRDLLKEFYHDYKSSIATESVSYGILQARSSLSKTYYRDEAMQGLSQWALLDSWSHFSNSQLRGLAGVLDGLRRKLLQRGRISFSGTGDETMLPIHEKMTDLFMDSLGMDVVSLKDSFSVDPSLFDNLRRQPWFSCDFKENQLYFYQLPAGNANNVLVLPAVDGNHPLAKSMMVLSSLMNSDFLWNQVRMQGGAYGASAGANTAEGVFTFCSYRDPSVQKTMEVFRSSLVFYGETQVGQDVIDMAVITLVGKELRPKVPGTRGMVAYRRYLYGLTDELRQRNRKELLEVTGEGVQQAALWLLNHISQARTVSFLGVETIKKELSAIEEKKLKEEKTLFSLTV